MFRFSDETNLLAINKQEYYKKYQTIFEQIKRRDVRGSDFLGWIDLLEDYDYSINDSIKKDVNKLREKAKTMIVIGVGGSYLGSKAIAHALEHQILTNEYNLIFIGNSLDEGYLDEVLTYLETNDFVVNVISKSGTTLETTVAFHIIYDVLLKKYGKNETNQRIIITTDTSRGELHELAAQENICAYEIVDDIGGRYSVFTPVGLISLAFINCDIDALIKGACKAKDDVYTSETNSAFEYAINRLEQFNHNKQVEAYVIYNQKLKYVIEWIKQLFGESEGKEGKGLLPIAFSYSTDLHSLGQFVQDGNKILFETIINVKQAQNNLEVNNRLTSKTIEQLKEKNLAKMNQLVLNAVRKAHVQDGNVPNLLIEIETIDEYNLGYLLSFMMYTCMYSAYLFEVNPFDQPGVEIYKKEIKKLL